MANFIPIDTNLISIDNPSGENLDITPAITRLAVSFTMDMASEINFEVVDKDFKFASAGYFDIRRDITYAGMLFEVSAVDVQRSSGLDPLYRVSARSKAIQLMKRDKGAEAFTGLTSTQFAATVAARFSMGFFGQETTKSQTIVKGRSSNVDESVWDVLTRVANDNQFVVFETNNILFFTSQTHLAGKWGDPDFIFQGNTLIPFGWPESLDSVFPGAQKRYQLMEMPTLRRSDDDPMDAEGTILVERTNGRQLRPGMTINLTGIPKFEGLYLITSVDFEEGVSDPVTVNFRIPSDPEAPSGSGGGGVSTETGQSEVLPADIINLLNEQLKRTMGYDEAGVPYFNHAGTYNSLKANVKYHAELIWTELTVFGKDTRFSQAITALNGPNTIAGRALNAIKDPLYRNIITAQQTSVPVSLRNALSNATTEVTGRSSGNYFSRLYNQALTDAKRLWEATSVSEQNSLYNLFERRYGTQNPAYRIISRPQVRSQVRYEMPNLLSTNRPPTDR
jgi:hypothetical protein